MRSKSSTSVPEPSLPAVPPATSFIEAARKAQIIESAIATIAELGYGRASLAEIAKRAGISKSVISYYFASKDELILQVVDAVYAKGSAFMSELVQSQANATAALRMYVEMNVAFMKAYRHDVLALVEIVVGFRDESGAPRFKPSDGEGVVMPLAELLRWGQRDGEFREFSPMVMAFAIRAAIDELPTRLSLHSDADLDETAAELAALFHLATTKQDEPMKSGKARGKQ